MYQRDKNCSGPYLYAEKLVSGVELTTPTRAIYVKVHHNPAWSVALETSTYKFKSGVSLDSGFRQGNIVPIAITMYTYSGVNPPEIWGLW